MPDDFELGGLPFGAYKALIGTYNAAAGTWGTLSRIFSVEMTRATEQLVSAIARGDARITAAAAYREGAELGLRFTGMNPSTLAALTGKNVTNISDYYQVQGVGGDVMPYFGIAIKSRSADGSCAWVWFPQAKLMQNYPFFLAEYGTFNSPELTIQCIDNTNWGIWNLITFASDFDITAFPPSNIAQVS